MFLIFALLMLVNYATDREKFLFAYRFDVFGMPINVLDVLIGVGLVAVPLVWHKRSFMTETTHRALWWTVGLLVVAAMGGGVMGFFVGADPREMAVMARNVMNLAAGLLVGYAAVSTMKQVTWAGYVILLSSFLSACTAIIFLRDSTETLGYIGSTFNNLRSVNKGGDLGVVAAGFVAFCLVSRLRYMPWLVAMGVLIVSTVGAYSLPHRSSYLVATLSIGFAALVLPAVAVSRRVGTTAVMGGVLAVVLVLSMAAYSRATGRNFSDYVETRILSMLPGTELRKENHAWDTRVPGLVIELRIWLTSPIVGRGFGCQNVLVEHFAPGAPPDAGFRHNVWTAALAEGGLPLFAGYLLPCVFAVVIGRRMVRARTDRTTVMIGAIAAINGVMNFMYASVTMHLNLQRAAIPFGLICGLLLRARQMQVAMVREYDGYLDAPAYDAEGHPLLLPDGDLSPAYAAPRF
jgi:hypothetical protein